MLKLDGDDLDIGSAMELRHRELSREQVHKFCFGSVRALDPATGAYLWEHCLSSAYRVMAPPIVVPGLVVASVGPSFFVLDATSGATLFRSQDNAKDSTFDEAATIAYGALYIGNLDGTLSAFAPES